MDIVVVGLNHRTATVELRERMSFSKQEASDISAQARSSNMVKEILVLSTCNRTELYGVPNGWNGERTNPLESLLLSYHNLQPENVNGAFYRHQDREAVRHIYRVASGLDSMMLGEAETIGAGWRWENQFLERIRSVTAQDIQRVARRYLNADNRTVGILVPVPPKQQQSFSSVPTPHRRS